MSTLLRQVSYRRRSEATASYPKTDPTTASTPPHRTSVRRMPLARGESMTSALKQAADEFLVRYGGDVFPNLFTSAKGTIVTDSEGREYLDFTSGQMCATIGHNHPAIVAAVNRAGKKAFHMFSGMIPEVVVELAETLARDWLPGDIKRTIFINTGSEASEVALRM